MVLEGGPGDTQVLEGGTQVLADTAVLNRVPPAPAQPPPPPLPPPHALDAATLACAQRALRRDFARAGAGDAERAVRMSVAAAEVAAVAAALQDSAAAGGTAGGCSMGERSQDVLAGAIKLARVDLGVAVWHLTPPADGAPRVESIHGSELDRTADVMSALREASEDVPEATLFPTGTTQLTPHTAAAAAAAAAEAGGPACGTEVVPSLVASLSRARCQQAAEVPAQVPALSSGEPVPLSAPLPVAPSPPAAPAVPGNAATAQPLSLSFFAPPSVEAPPALVEPRHSDHTQPEGPWPSQGLHLRFSLEQASLEQHHQGLLLAPAAAAAAGGITPPPSAPPALSPRGQPAAGSGTKGGGGEAAVAAGAAVHAIAPRPVLPQSEDATVDEATRPSSAAVTAAAAVARALPMSPFANANGGTMERSGGAYDLTVVPATFPTPSHTVTGQRSVIEQGDVRDCEGGAAAAALNVYPSLGGCFPPLPPRPLTLVMEHTQGGGGTQGCEFGEAPAEVQAVPHSAPLPMVPPPGVTADQLRSLRSLFGAGAAGVPPDSVTAPALREERCPRGPATTMTWRTPAGGAALSDVVVVPETEHPDDDVAVAGAEVPQPLPPIAETAPRGALLAAPRISSPPLTSPPEDEEPRGAPGVRDSDGAERGGMVWGTEEANMSARPAGWRSDTAPPIAAVGAAGRGGVAGTDGAADGAAAVAVGAAAAPRTGATRAERLNVPPSRLFEEGGDGVVRRVVPPVQAAPPRRDAPEDPFAFPDSQEGAAAAAAAAGGAKKAVVSGWRVFSRLVEKEKAAAKAPPPPGPSRLGAAAAAAKAPQPQQRGAKQAPAQPAAVAPLAAAPAVRKPDAGLAAAVAITSSDDDDNDDTVAPVRRTAAAAAAAAPAPQRRAAKRSPLLTSSSSSSDEDDDDALDSSDGDEHQETGAALADEDEDYAPPAARAAAPPVTKARKAARTSEAARTPKAADAGGAGAGAATFGCSKCRWRSDGCGKCRLGSASGGVGRAAAAGQTGPPASTLRRSRAARAEAAGKGDEDAADAEEEAEEEEEGLAGAKQAHASKRPRGGAGPGQAFVAPAIFAGLSFLTTGFAAADSAARVALEARLRAAGGVVLSSLPPPPPPPPPSAGSAPGARCAAASSHVVVSASFVRTPKLLFALAVGCPLVKPAWIDACLAANRRLAPPNPRGAGGATYAAHAHADAPPPLSAAAAAAAAGPLAALRGARLVLAGEPAWCASLAVVLRYAGAAVTEVDARAAALDALMLPRGSTVVCQAERAPPPLAAAARAAACRCVRTEWAVQCLLQRRCVEVDDHDAAPQAPLPPHKPSPQAALQPPLHPPADSSVRGVRAPTHDNTRSSPGAHQHQHQQPSTARSPADHRQQQRASVARCSDAFPQVDLFSRERDCAGCSDALQRVKVRCGCVTCGRPLCLKGKDSCFRKHQLGLL